MNLGFSYVGFVYLLMLTIPNLIWTKNQPKNYTAEHENKLLVLCERIGQIIVATAALIFSDFNFKPFSVWSILLIVSFTFMIMYEFWWFRYFKSSKSLKDFYSSFLGVPIAGATLPVIGFLLLGVYGRNPILIPGILLLGVGHIGIHLQHKKELTDT